MATNNLKETSDSFDDDSKEIPANLGSVQHDSTVHINAKTGGQVIGGVSANTGNRTQAENESPEGA